MKTFKLDTIQTIVKCKKCLDKIFSRYPGEFRMCKCKAIYIDQTDHYIRMGGDTTLMEEVKDAKKTGK